MHFDPRAGILTLQRGVALHPGLTRAQVLQCAGSGGALHPGDGPPHGRYEEVSVNRDTADILAVATAHLTGSAATLCSWAIAPCMYYRWPQAKVDDACIRRMRHWFATEFGVYLPSCGEWGRVDVRYDYWGEATRVLCIYRAAFNMEEDWADFRRRYRF